MVDVDFSGYRDEYLKRRISIRLRATNTNTFGRYLQYLDKNPDEYSILLNEITVNYTIFMRDQDVYNYLEYQLSAKTFPEISSSDLERRLRFRRRTLLTCNFNT